MREVEALREMEDEIQKGNYVRAAMLAECLGRPVQEIRRLREEAIRQLIVECRNAQGALALAEQYHLTREEVVRLLESLLKESKEKKTFLRRQYDTRTMRYLTFGEWVKEYFRLDKVDDTQVLEIHSKHTVLKEGENAVGLRPTPKGDGIET